MYRTITAGLTLAALVTAFTLPASAADRVRFRCDAVGATDISMSAKYETRNARRKFSTEFEAAPGLGYTAGQQLAVQVKGVKVGNMTLDTVVGGDIVGDLNFDTQPQLPDSIRFPANWPTGVGRGSLIKVLKGTQVILGCRLG